MFCKLSDSKAAEEKRFKKTFVKTYVVGQSMPILITLDSSILPFLKSSQDLALAAWNDMFLCEETLSAQNHHDRR